jgi:hypothetical protein
VLCVRLQKLQLHGFSSLFSSQTTTRFTNSGPIPSAWSTLTRLTNLDLAGIAMNLDSSLPVELSTLLRLERFAIRKPRK